MALIAFQLIGVPGIQRGAIDQTAFDLAQQTVADADHLELELGDIDGRDRHAIGIVARQDDAAAEADQRRLVAQLDGNGLGGGQLFVGRRGQALLERQIVGLVEIEARRCTAGCRSAWVAMRVSGSSLQIVFVMRLAGLIELAGEHQTGFGLRLGGVDLEAMEGEFGRRGGLGGGRGAGGGGNAALDAGDDAVVIGRGRAIRRGTAAQQIERAGQQRQHDDRRAADDQKPLLHVHPPSQLLRRAGRRQPTLARTASKGSAPKMAAE